MLIEQASSIIAQTVSAYPAAISNGDIAIWGFVVSFVVISVVGLLAGRDA